MSGTPPLPTKKTVRDPKPGTAEAFSRGCACPVIDNHHGAGYRGDPNRWATVPDCPLHGRRKPLRDVRLVERELKSSTGGW